MGSNSRRPLNIYCRIFTLCTGGACPRPCMSGTSIRSLLLYRGSSSLCGYPFSPNTRIGTKGTTHVQTYLTNDPATRSSRDYCRVPGAVTGAGFSCHSASFGCASLHCVSEFCVIKHSASHALETIIKYIAHTRNSRSNGIQSCYFSHFLCRYPGLVYDGV